MNKIIAFELSEDKEKVFLQKADSKWIKKKVYHIGEKGVLCTDLETYIKFSNYVKPKNRNSMERRKITKIKGGVSYEARV